MAERGLSRRSAFAAGCCLLALYWLYLHPPGLGRIGYAQDLGEAELCRQLIADGLNEHGRPWFRTTRLMAPFGTSTAYYSWSMERDWLGAYFWNWNPDFPYLWLYFGASLLIAYLAVWYFSSKIGVPRGIAWLFAAAAVIVNVPRHQKIYYHFEHITPHWIYVSLFLDAWIVHQFVRNRTWSRSLEAWRVLVLLATFGLGGYYWGPMLLEWAIVRAYLLIAALRRRQTGAPIVVDGSPGRVALPVVLGLGFLLLAARWFTPLAREAWALGPIAQDLWRPVPLRMVARPLWLEWLLLPFTPIPSLSISGLRQALSQTGLPPLGEYETVVSIGWIYWIPLAASLLAGARRFGGRGLDAQRPFLIVLAILLAYMTLDPAYHVQDGLQYVVPFLSFFRVQSRVGLFLCPIVAALIGLGWTDLSNAVHRWAVDRGRKARWALYTIATAFAATSCLELLRLALPIVTMPPMDTSTRTMLADLNRASGTTVLDMPFCVANIACDPDQCPIAGSIAAVYLTGYHDKRVYGSYLSRTVPAQCGTYDREPYRSWFAAWKANRCLADGEWQDFCRYLEDRPETSAVLVYTDLWPAVQDPACRDEFDRHLGSPRAAAVTLTEARRGAVAAGRTGLRWYAARCADGSY